MRPCFMFFFVSARVCFAPLPCFARVRRATPSPPYRLSGGVHAVCARALPSRPRHARRACRRCPASARPTAAAAAVARRTRGARSARRWRSVTRSSSRATPASARARARADAFGRYSRRLKTPTAHAPPHCFLGRRRAQGAGRRAPPARARLARSARLPSVRRLLTGDPPPPEGGGLRFRLMGIDWLCDARSYPYAPRGVAFSVAGSPTRSCCSAHSPSTRSPPPARARTARATAVAARSTTAGATACRRRRSRSLPTARRS